MCKIVSISLALLLPFVLAAAAEPVSFVPFTFAGRVTDYAHIAYGADAAVEVRLKNAAGELLTKATTQTRGNTSYNYVLAVPVATQPMKGYACVGDTVTFEFVDPYGKIYTGLVPVAESVVGNPGTVKRLDVMLITDENGDGVDDTYMASIEYWMWLNDIPGPYDPAADYDGDGHSNYEEYVAGTNPCDKTDRLNIHKMAMDQGLGDYIRLEIPVKQGRSYSVVDTGSLVRPNWKLTKFSESPDEEPNATYLNTGVTEVSYRVIFVKKEGDTHFYKVRVE